MLKKKGITAQSAEREVSCRGSGDHLPRRSTGFGYDRDEHGRPRYGYFAWAKALHDVGGLHIIGTERHESRRIDNQLRGRAGRQGDPGSSQFYLSLEDELMRRFGAENIMGMMERLGFEEDQPIESQLITRAIESAQKRVEGNNFDVRKVVLQYDDVMNQQREIIYKQRREVLESENIREIVLEMIKPVIERIVKLIVRTMKFRRNGICKRLSITRIAISCTRRLD